MPRPCRRPLAVFAAIAAWFIWASEAAQAAGCDRREEVISELDEIYGETKRGVGLSLDGQMVFEIWASDAKGTWTILRTTPDGVACPIAVGENWREFEPVLAGEAL